MRVLAIDASLRHTGVAIVDANNGKPRSLYFGTIHNANSVRSSSCLVAIRDRLAELIREHEPDCCSLESVIYVKSYKTAIVLGAARGAAILAAAENGLPSFEYAPNRRKKSWPKNGRITRWKMNCSCWIMSRSTQLAEHRINRACLAQPICHIHFLRSIAAARPLITDPVN